MPFVPAANTLLAELRYTYGSVKMENTLYFQGSAGVTPALGITLGNALISWWNAHFKAPSPTAFSLVEVHVTDLSTQTSFTESVTTGLPSAGSSTVDGLPFNVAFCISFRTANRGRSGRGRNYVAGLTEADTQYSTIISTRRAAIVSAYLLLVGAGTFVAGLQWVVVSRFSGGAPRLNALVQPITTAFAVDDITDSQRRRLPGRGK